MTPVTTLDATPRIEVAFPDLAPHAEGNIGLPYVWSFTSARPGPHVLVQALTHGNEVCGAIVLDSLLREAFRPSRGTLTLVFANIRAYARFDASDPFASRYVDEDFNRLWDPRTLDGPRNSVELARARELRPLYDRVDVLLDLHSMSEHCAPLALAGVQHKGAALARKVGTPEHLIVDAGHASGRRLRDYAAFGASGNTRAALLVECGQHWERSAPLVAAQTTARLLAAFDMADAGWIDAHIDAVALPPQQTIEVTDAITIGSDDFRFVLKLRGLQVVERAGTLYARDGAAELRTPYDCCVMLMPTRRSKRGETAVRLGRYVATR